MAFYTQLNNECLLFHFTSLKRNTNNYKLVLQQDSIENIRLHGFDSQIPGSSNNKYSNGPMISGNLPGFSDTLKLDTILNSNKNAEQPFKSVFQSHSLKTNDIGPLENHPLNIDWISIHFIVLLGFLAWSRINFHKRLNQIFKSFFAPRYLNQLAREGNIFRERIAIPLLVIYLVSISMLLYLLIRDFSDFHLEGYTNFKLFSIILFIVLVLWFIKNIIVHFIGITFKNGLLISEFMLTNFVFNLMTGLLLFPIIAVSVYTSSKHVLIAALIFWLLIFVYKIVREFFIGLSLIKFSLFNRFLYICTLEILPILIFIKLVMSNLNFV